jgi:hypothetical protein
MAFPSYISCSGDTATQQNKPETLKNLEAFRLAVRVLEKERKKVNRFFCHANYVLMGTT